MFLNIIRQMHKIKTWCVTISINNKHENYGLDKLCISTKNSQAVYSQDKVYILNSLSK